MLHVGQRRKMKILLLFACMLAKMGLTSPWSSYSSSTFPFFPVVVGSACLLIIQLVSVVIHTLRDGLRQRGQLGSLPPAFSHGLHLVGGWYRSPAYMEKVSLVSAYILIFCLAAVFRPGSLALVFSCLINTFCAKICSKLMD